MIWETAYLEEATTVARQTVDAPPADKAGQPAWATLGQSSIVGMGGQMRWLTWRRLQPIVGLQPADRNIAATATGTQGAWHLLGVASFVARAPMAGPVRRPPSYPAPAMGPSMTTTETPQPSGHGPISDLDVT